MTKVRSLCTKDEITFSRSSNDMGFLTEFFILKIKTDAAPFSLTCGSTRFEYKQSEKNVEDFKRVDLVEQTHSNW